MWVKSWMPDTSGLPLFEQRGTQLIRSIIDEVDDTRFLIADQLGEWNVICAGCWQYTQTNPCEYCNVVSDASGQVLHDDDNSSLVDFYTWGKYEESTKGKISVQWEEIEYWWAKTLKLHLSCQFQIWGSEYRVMIKPHLKNKIRGIYNKWSKSWVSDETFQKIVIATNKLCSNPEKYNLSKLKIFKD